MVEINLIKKDYTQAMEELVSTIDSSKVETYIIDFEADHSNSKIIRDFMGEIFNAHNIHRPWRGRFILIADELINNAIEHGSAPGDIDQCIIQAGIQDDGTFMISLEVHDTGRGIHQFDPKKLEKARIRAEDSGEIYLKKRGRGLFHITNKLVDSLSFKENDRGWLSVKVKKCIDVQEFSSDTPTDTTAVASV